MSELIISINMDMAPSQIFPVKLVFGVKITLAAMLTGSKYPLTESTQIKHFFKAKMTMKLFII